MKITKRTELLLPNRQKIILSPNDFLASGGEASVYRRGQTIIKLYTDTDRLRRENLPDKIQLLAKMKHPFVVAPQGVVSDRAGNPLGYQMPFVSGEPLARFFTNDFRSGLGFTVDDNHLLVERMREVVQFAHGRRALLIDANELNWLVTKADIHRPEPRIIDVDSWAIGNWKAQVIMPSIRDWQSKTFNQGTDWFAWGIVTFQIYTGIHPYKGTLPGYKRYDLQKRMKDQAPVFSKGVRLNRAVRDFSIIPGPLLDWYVDTFAHGKRTVPPSPLVTGQAVTQVGRTFRLVAKAGQNLIFDKIYVGEQEIVRVFPIGVALLKNGQLVDLATKQQFSGRYNQAVEVVRVSDGWLIANPQGQQYTFHYARLANGQTQELSLPLDIRRLVRFENRLFAVTERGLTELLVKIIGRQPFLVTGQTWGVLINSTKWFDGVGIQNALGAIYLITPFGENACAQVRVPELDNLRVVNARGGYRFVTVIALDAKGNYYKLEFSFDKEYRTYRLWRGQADNPELNIAILPKGVCATVVEDGKLDIFVPFSGVLNSVQDKHITTNMFLTNWDNKVVYIQNKNLWQIKLRS